MHKLIIIGLDAADYQLTQQFMEEGEMPRLSAVADQSAFSLLKSSVPSQTAPAWTSITTGVNPGKHGIYYFYNFSNSPLTIVNSTDSSTPRIWDYVGAMNQRSVVVNVPITYPARKIFGSMISGIPPWFFDKRSVHPEVLYERLRASDYEIDTPMSRALEKQPDTLVTKLIATEDKRVKVFLDLLREESCWSFGMIVLTALDRLQHKALGKGEKELRAVKRAYHEVDSLVGKMIDSLGEEINYLVVSDHGFNKRPLAFYPNAWLHSKGLLHRKSSVPYRLTRVAHNVFDGHFLWLPQSITRRFQGAASAIRSIDAIDLEKSRAYVPGTDGVIVVKSKEDEELVASGLSKIKDEDGKEICKVYPRSQIYKGDKIDQAPQLLIVPRDDINIKADPFSRSFVSMSGNFPKSNHGPNGIFLATGPDIKRTRGVDLSIEDIAPTALVLLGIRPPDFMDGSPIEQTMAQNSPGSLAVAEVKPDVNAFSFSEEDEKMIMGNLQRLGYT